MSSTDDYTQWDADDTNYYTNPHTVTLDINITGLPSTVQPMRITDNGSLRLSLPNYITGNYRVDVPNPMAHRAYKKFPFGYTNQQMGYYLLYDPYKANDDNTVYMVRQLAYGSYRVTPTFGIFIGKAWGTKTDYTFALQPYRGTVTGAPFFSLLGVTGGTGVNMAYIFYTPFDDIIEHCIDAVKDSRYWGSNGWQLHNGYWYKRIGTIPASSLIGASRYGNYNYMVPFDTVSDIAVYMQRRDVLTGFQTTRSHYIFLECQATFTMDNIQYTLSQTFNPDVATSNIAKSDTGNNAPTYTENPTLVTVAATANRLGHTITHYFKPEPINIFDDDYSQYLAVDLIPCGTRLGDKKLHGIKDETISLTYDDNRITTLPYYTSSGNNSPGIYDIIRYDADITFTPQYE